MVDNKEHDKLTEEICTHQEYSIRVMIYTMLLIGGIIGVKSDIQMPSIVGVSIVLISSLIYLIGAARKIFVIGAYISVFSDEETKDSWETLLHEFSSKFHFFYETKIIAVIYFLISVGFFYLFFSEKPWFVGIIFGICLLLCLTLFFIPDRKRFYVERWEEIKNSRESNPDGA